MDATNECTFSLPTPDSDRSWKRREGKKKRKRERERERTTTTSRSCLGCFSRGEHARAETLRDLPRRSYPPPEKKCSLRETPNAQPSIPGCSHFNERNHRRNPLSLRNMRQCLAYMSRSGRSLLHPFVSRCCSTAPRVPSISFRSSKYNVHISAACVHFIPRARARACINPEHLRAGLEIN